MSLEVIENKLPKDTKKEAGEGVDLQTGKHLGLFFFGWLGLQIVGTLVSLILVFSGIKDEGLLDILVNSLTYSVAFVGLLLILLNDAEKLLPSFKNFKFLLVGLITFGAIFAFDYIYQIITNILYPISDNANQGSIESIVTLYPIASLIIFGVIGPICEELTYRVGLFSLINKKSKWAAYVVTILVFAFIHFDETAIVNFALGKGTLENLINELLNLPTYMFAAFALSYTYDKYGFSASVWAHIVNNLFSIGITIMYANL